jgi:serine/threonine-protein kinase RsbW
MIERNMKMPIQRQFTADLSNLARVREFIAEVGEEYCDSPGFIYDLCLAVDEAITNIILHGYQGNEGQIEICVQGENDAVAVYIRDWAPKFDPTKLPSPDILVPLDQRKPGGLGVFIIRSNVDRMEYRRSKDGVNELKLVKQIGRKKLPLVQAEL